MRSIGMCAAALVLALAACGPAPASGPIPPTGRAEATTLDGRFQLGFAIDRATVRPDEPITGTAMLQLLVAGGVTLTGSSDLFAFDVLEVGGEGRHVAPVRPADCAPHRLVSTAPLTSPIVKSGASDGGFGASFLRGDDVLLPKGDWDITAVAQFTDGDACRGQAHNIRATVRVHVTD